MPAKSSSRDDGKTQEELDAAIRQIVSKAVVSDEVVDIFSAAGLSRPDISILSDEFLEEVRELPHRNLAVELLQRLLHDEIHSDRGGTWCRLGPLLNGWRSPSGVIRTARSRRRRSSPN